MPRAHLTRGPFLVRGTHPMRWRSSGWPGGRLAAFRRERPWRVMTTVTHEPISVVSDDGKSSSSLRDFLVNHREQDGAAKRGGGRQPSPSTWRRANLANAYEPAHEPDAEERNAPASIALAP